MLRSIRAACAISAMKLDPAVVKLLDLDPDSTSISSGSGGCSSASSSKITSRLSDGSEKLFFMKSGKGKEAQMMFEGIILKSMLSWSLDLLLTLRH